MKLAHAIKVGEKTLSAMNTPSLSVDERIAITVLLRFANRVLAARESVRALSRAVTGDDELNQEDLFEKKGDAIGQEDR